MSSKRQQIIDAIKTRFQGITVAAGYNFNLGSNVYEWRTSALPAANMPALLIADISSTRNDSGVIGKFRYTLNIEADIVAQDTPANTRKMIADVLKAIGVGETWGGLAQTTEQPESDEMQFEQNEKTIAGARIKFSIIYDALQWQM